MGFLTGIAELKTEPICAMFKGYLSKAGNCSFALCLAVGELLALAIKCKHLS